MTADANVKQPTTDLSSRLYPRRTIIGLTSLHLTSALAMSGAPSLLQLPHDPDRAPASVLASLAHECETLGITSFDVYGDFASDKETSYLRKFEAEMAQEFGKEDAVFMPSGVMAQSIALLIHSGSVPNKKRRFACHESSHLLLHEQEAYQHLLHMDPVVIKSKVDGFRRRPLSMEDVENALAQQHCDETFTLILELPHRELGGKCTPWQDILRMREYCDSHDMKLHCDGARVFEATVGYDKTLMEIAEPFDSVYISFYKGLAGLSGAMLLGSSSFCAEARLWLRRFGGNLYTLIPYAVSGWTGYRKHWVDDTNMTFRGKRDKLLRIIEALSSEDRIRSCVSFDPELPNVNMIHGYLFFSKQECMDAVDIVEKQCGIRVLSRIRDVEESDPAYREGYRSNFEWTMGEANGVIDDEVFLRGWKEFAAALETIATSSRSSS